MKRSTEALYQPLIERDLGAIPSAVEAFLQAHGAADLWLAVTRFAVLAYAPSQHAKRAVMACRAVDELRDASGAWNVGLLVACARYAAMSRQPWSEPPLLDPPATDATQSASIGELEAAISADDRVRAERWLSAALPDAETAMQSLARGDALLMLDTARVLVGKLGEKGRYALFRMPLLELLTGEDDEETSASPDGLIARVIEERGSIASVRAVLIHAAAHADERESADMRTDLIPEPYELGRDYAQTLLAYAVARKLPKDSDVAGFLAAVRVNLEHGDSFADWSFA
ncbi:MAG TPA: hypothetical protein VF701_01335 [Thermoanaerobaculia bacterium]